MWVIWIVKIVGCDQYLEMYEAIELESTNNNCLDFHSPVENLDSNLRAIQHSIGVNRVVASSCSGLMERYSNFKQLSCLFYRFLSFVLVAPLFQAFTAITLLHGVETWKVLTCVY